MRGIMNLRTIIVLFVVLAQFSYAATTTIDNANYTGGMSKWYFASDMQFTTTFTVAANGTTLQAGDSVVDGSTLTVTPSITATWATPDLAIVSIYPNCLAGCPTLINSTGVNTNRPIVWLASATFNHHQTLGTSNDWNNNATLAAQLEPFATQPMTFDPGSSRPLQYNKAGGANMYCKGTLEVLDGSTVVGNSPLPAVAPISFTLSGAGSHQLATRLKDVVCFGAVEVNPGTSWFYNYYFTRKTPSTIIPATMGISGIIPIIVSSCNITHTTYTTTGSVNEDYFMLITPITNNGATAQVQSVTSGNSDYTVEPFPVSLCATLGFPSSLCPTDNGFNTNIPTGSTQDTYVLATRGASPDPANALPVTYNALASGQSCTDALSIPGGNTPVVCGIDPSAFTMRTQDLLHSTVACDNLAGNSVPCVGDNWYWDSGLVGDFTLKDNTQADAYSTSAPGSSGLLNYNSASAWCFSEISLTIDPARCVFNPVSANIAISSSQHFALVCEETPTSATYDLINGLVGITLDDTPATAGTTFTADSLPSVGDLRGVATLPSDASPIIGAVAIAPINVFTPDIVSCEITPAVVAPPDINLSSNMGMEWTVVCRNAASEVVPCSGSDWRWENGLNGPAPTEHPVATSERVMTHSTSSGGSSGQLNYYTTGASCTSSVTLLDHLDGWCTFSPPSARLNYNAVKAFTLSCMNNLSGTPVPFTPDSATYDLIAGLAGSTSAESVTGVTYTAPATNSSGELEGLGYTSLFAPARYLAAQAPIRVGTGGGNNDQGDTEWCTIDGLGVSTITVHPGESGWVQLKCGKEHNETCAVGDVQWSIDPSGLMSYQSDNLGFAYDLLKDVPVGTHFTLYATILSKNHGCSKELYVDKPDCYDQS